MSAAGGAMIEPRQAHPPELLLQAQGIRWAQEHPELPKYIVVLRRKGKEITKTYLVPQD